MKKLLSLVAALTFSLPVVSFAFGHTTILTENYSTGKATGQVPYVDGLKEMYQQNNLNHVIKEQAAALAKEAGGQAALSYEVTVNRPTLFSVILKAQGNRTVYAGLNLDTRNGAILEAKDLLYTNVPEYKEYLEGKSFVFAENGVRIPSVTGGPLDVTIPYTKLLKAINVAEGSRLLTSYKLTPEAEEKTLYLKPGELVALYLEANPTSGNNWTMVDQSGHTGFVNLGHSFTLPLVNPTGAAGSSGTTILFAAFDAPGSYQIKAAYGKTLTAPLRERVFHFVVE